MRAILLAGTVDEATAYARAASLSRRDYVAVGSAHTLDGLRLTDEDLIAEFNSFRKRRDAGTIEDRLLRSIVECKAKPRWERIGQ